jgi:phosphatidylserine synthase
MGRWAYFLFGVCAVKRRYAKFYIDRQDEPIFPGSPVTVKAAAFTFLTIKVEHAVSDIAFNLFMKGFAYGLGVHPQNLFPR